MPSKSFVKRKMCRQDYYPNAATSHNITPKASTSCKVAFHGR